MKDSPGRVSEFSMVDIKFYIAGVNINFLGDTQAGLVMKIFQEGQQLPALL